MVGEATYFKNKDDIWKVKVDHLLYTFGSLLGKLDSQQRNHVKKNMNKNTFRNTVFFLEENP